MGVFEIIQEKAIEIVALAVTAYITYLQGRKEGEAKLKQAQADALKTTQEVYDTFTEDMRLKYEELREDVKALHEETVALKSENKKYREQIVSLDETISKLHVAIEECTKKIKTKNG